MFSGNDLGEMIADILRLHQEFPKKPEKAFRKFDGRTPYGVHPILLAMLLLHEEFLPEDFRIIGAKVLLGHDLVEDTTELLPSWCQKQDGTEQLIHELTFVDGENPLTDIWNRSDKAILLKFYDNVANLMCVGKMKPSRIEERKKNVLKHLSWVRARYPRLEIVKIAQGLLGL